MTDDEFIDQFEQCTLPFEEWTHRNHVRTAFHYIRRYGIDEAIHRLREGIKRYNAANDVPEGPNVGYNETTTVAFARIIAAVMAAYEGPFPAPDGETFCDLHPQLMNSRILRFFYSPARRMHPDARTSYIEPDLAPLPRIVAGQPEGRSLPGPHLEP